jgi:hypothetical protein
VYLLLPERQTTDRYVSLALFVSLSTVQACFSILSIFDSYTPACNIFNSYVKGPIYMYINIRM